LRKKIPKIHDDSCGVDSPPCTPTVMITAIGPVAANTSPMRPFAR